MYFRDVAKYCQNRRNKGKTKQFLFIKFLNTTRDYTLHVEKVYRSARRDHTMNASVGAPPTSASD